VCQVTRIWVDVDSFHTRLVVRFINFTASVRNILDSHKATADVFRIPYHQQNGGSKNFGGRINIILPFFHSTVCPATGPQHLPKAFP
jgi:hypothetical protein